MARNPIASLAKVSYTTTRPTGAGGQTGAAVAHLTGLLGTELLPMTTDTQQRLKLDSPHEMFEIYFNGAPDIVKGDYVVSSKARRVKHAEPWSGFGVAVWHVIVEDNP